MTVEQGKDKGSDTESKLLKTRVLLETFVGFCFSSKGEKVGQHTQRTVTRNRGFERESLTEPCQDGAVRDTPLISGHLAEVTWLWGKLRLLIPWCVFPAGPRS